MKLRAVLAGFLLILCVVNNAEAQMPEDIWREYQYLKPPYSELRGSGIVFEEPYYSLAIKEIASIELQLEPRRLLWILIDMMNRLPNDYQDLFREFWGRLSPVATEYDLLSLLTSNQINKLPPDLNWFVDDAVDSFLRKEIDPFFVREAGCRGPKRYQQIFLEKFFAGNPSSRELATGGMYCEEYKGLFLEKFLDHPYPKKDELIEVLSTIIKFPALHDRYFSLLLMRQHELDSNELLFIESECKIELYCNFFTNLQLSAAFKRRRELIEIMQKKQ